MRSKTILPIDIRCDSQYSGKECLEAMGVRFIRVQYGPSGEESCWEVTLPTGWMISPIDGSPQWSWLLDGQHRQRAKIFQSLKIYDKRHHMILLTKYQIMCEKDHMGRWTARVVGGGWEVGFTNSNEQSAHASAVQWLHDNYPDWRNPAAYWD